VNLNCIKWVQNIQKIIIPGRPKCAKIWIFGIEIWNLATLVLEVLPSFLGFDSVDTTSRAG
jgi:hypothetical protein